MRKNIGPLDRTLRILLGVGLISQTFIGPQTPWGWLGIIPLATALVGWCPPYALLKISTCGTGKGAGKASSA